MDVGWGSELRDRSDGQDILGVRAVDQAMEASLVVGITTISQRGRYLTILPWALGEYFSADAGENVEKYDADRLRRFLFRSQFLILACTTVDKTPGDAGGALGARLYGHEMAALRSGSTIAFPDTGNGAILGTYFGPCSAIGLVRSGDAGRPYIITPRGKAIWEARNQFMQHHDEILAVLEQADEISFDLAQALAPYFSLKSLQRDSMEAEHLRDALLTPWSPSDPRQAEKVDAAYQRFSGTLTWLREEAPHGLDVERLLSRQLRQIVEGNGHQDETRVAWAQFEWRRRLHFALELMLSAICGTVLERRQATLPEIVSAWLEDSDFPEFLLEIWPSAPDAAQRSGRTAVDSIASNFALEQGISGNFYQLPGAHAQAMAGFALLAAVARQSAQLRAHGLFTDRGRTGEMALAVIDEAGEEPFPETLLRLTDIVARAHLVTTFRKMESGQKCSLRFFPEGARLRSTGDGAGAGRSGPRLGNVIRIFRDAGVPGLEASA